jgi:hypothetical protein
MASDPEEFEAQPAELLEGHVGRHHTVSAGQREGSEVGVHPELGRGGITESVTLPVSRQASRFIGAKRDAVVGQEGLVDRPRLSVRQGRIAVGRRTAALVSRRRRVY